MRPVPVVTFGFLGFVIRITGRKFLPIRLINFHYSVFELLIQRRGQAESIQDRLLQRRSLNLSPFVARQYWLRCRVSLHCFCANLAQ